MVGDQVVLKSGNLVHAPSTVIFGCCQESCLLPCRLGLETSRARSVLVPVQMALIPAT